MMNMSLLDEQEIPGNTSAKAGTWLLLGYYV